MSVTPLSVEGETAATIEVGLVGTAEPAPVVLGGLRVVSSVDPLNLTVGEDVGHVPVPPAGLSSEITGVAEPRARFAIGLGGEPGDEIGVVDFNPCPPAPGPKVVDDVDTQVPVEHTPGLGPVGGVEPHPVQDVVHVVDSTAADTLEGGSVGVPDLLVGNFGTIGTEQIS